MTTKICPREPTEEMLTSGSWYSEYPAECWQAMYDAWYAAIAVADAPPPREPRDKHDVNQMMKRALATAAPQEDAPLPRRLREVVCHLFLPTHAEAIHEAIAALASQEAALRERDARTVRACEMLREVYGEVNRDGVVMKGPVLRIVGDVIAALGSETA